MNEQSVQNVVNALRDQEEAKAKEAEAEEVKEEVKEQVEEQVEEQPEVVETPEVEGKPEEDPKLKQLEEQNRLLQQEIEMMKRVQAQVPPAPVQPKADDNPLAQHSDEELINAMDQYPEHKVKIMNELRRRDREAVKNEFNQTLQQKSEKQQYDSRAYEQWADLKDPNSEHYKLTSQIIASDPNYTNHPAGLYVAAQAAKTQLMEKELAELKKGSTKEAIARKQAEIQKEKAVEASQPNGLNRASSEPTIKDDLDKSYDSLLGARPGSPQFLEHLRRLEKKNKKAART